MMSRAIWLALSVFLLIVINVQPALAFTSLNGCLSNPQCAAALGVTGTSGVTQGVTTMALPTAARTAALLASTGGASTGLKVAVTGAVATGGALALHTLAPDKAQEFADQWAMPPVGGGDYAPWGGVRLRFYRYDQSSYQTTNVLSWNQEQYVNEFGQNRIRTSYVNCAGQAFSFGHTGGASLTTITAYEVCAPAQNDGQVTRDDIEQKLGAPTTLRPRYDEDGQTKYPPITFPDGGVVIGPDGEPKLVPPGGLYDPNTDTITDPGPNAEPDPNAPPETDPNAPDPDKVADPNNPDFGKVPEQPNTIEPAKFEKPNFVQYGWQVFSDKFPLDIIGDLEGGGTQTCPSWTFFGKTNQLCFVTETLAKLKIPVLLGFFIWAVVVL
jgi:hypothetical protein